MKRLTIPLVLIGLLLFLSGCATLGTGTDSSRKHIQSGLEHEEKGNYQKAIEHYTAAANSGYHAEAYIYLGNTYQRMETFSKAEKYYRIALEKLPNHADLHHNLAYLYFDQGIHLDEAEKLALRAIELNEESAHIDHYESTLSRIRALKSKRDQTQKAGP